MGMMKRSSYPNVLWCHYNSGNDYKEEDVKEENDEKEKEERL